MKAQFLSKQSWEKQQLYKLDNGCVVTVEFGHYGESISRIEDNLGYWHCSDGWKTIPERFSFAKSWCEPYLSHSQDVFRLIRPRFEKVY